MINDIFNLANIIFKRENKPQFAVTPVDKKSLRRETCCQLADSMAIHQRPQVCF